MKKDQALIFYGVMLLWLIAGVQNIYKTHKADFNWTVENIGVAEQILVNTDNVYTCND